jgi:TRAP-type mannitol/chloroaromatic compound transport system permease large subunit
VKDVSFATIFKGVVPFIVTDLIRLVILIAFPIIALWLPSRM